MSNPQSTQRYAEGTVYLQVRPHPNYLGECRVVKSTQRDPEVVEPGCVVVKVKLRIPQRAFRPLEPEAVVTVPESLVQHIVEVEAADPS